MRIRLAIVLMLLVVSAASPQAPLLQLDDLDPSVQQWLRENLDDRVLQALTETDQERARKLFDDLLRDLQSEDIYDLGPLKETATVLLPLLLQFDETRPYAEWLQTRLDYLETSAELRRRMQPPPPKPGVPKPPLPRPSLQLQRSVWDKQLEKRPLPPHAQTYVPRLKPIFVAGGAPSQLVWLAEVESSFNPGAKSPAGAAGMFQLTRPTAKRLGLSTWLPDERLNAEKSARAAAKYLRYLHGRYGDWRLALAAYNAGESRVDVLLKKYKTRSFDAIASHLPAETQMYVPKCEATLKKREGLTFTELKLPKV
ncbi:MAG: lytic transglycosylase domain-containing protein [Verrucomicrobia bacterium]|nr:lytic transglycosylase domain-containing protein [Verrucomicrobiota bacterium]